MKLLGKDISPLKVMAYVGERLQVRGLVAPREQQSDVEGVEPKVDPLTFNLHALEANADATQGLPLETHRDGFAGRAVVLAKRLFRTAGQLFINEALGRQSVFNGHVRDSYAQLSAEVMRLRQRVAELEKIPLAPNGGEGQGEGKPKKSSQSQSQSQSQVKSSQKVLAPQVIPFARESAPPRPVLFSSDAKK